MSAKRALIVDDSRSARVILSRMLEGYGLEIDAAESAEQALEYLKTMKPDVIFMDHLMPGMDGFQAIQAIKSNSLTSMIPVMMYTSQEGELYVSQARALGAVGVLPKTVKQTELSRILYQLRLLPERRDGRVIVQPVTGSRTPTVVADDVPTLQIDAPPRLTMGEIETAIRNSIGPALQEQNVEIRRFVASSLDAFARRINADTRPAAAAPASDSTATVADESLPPPSMPPPPTLRWPLVAAIAGIALLPTVVLAILYTRTLQSTTQMMQSNARLSSVVEEQQGQLATLQRSIKAATDPSADAQTVAGALVESEAVPYGEAPLAGARLERLRDMVAKLKSQGFRGRVRIATYVGEFCLTGNGVEGYSVAADDLPVKRCDLVGNPFDDSLTTAQRQSLGFANLLATIKQQTADAVTIEVAYAGRRPSVPYPDVERSTKATAGDWNRAAAQNNRVEFAALPAG
ncbi:MAG TPA: response regulator [Steroidobacteraceae bacterium]|nr:response regulator [Steroidobacteraceae bacterium]